MCVIWKMSLDHFDMLDQSFRWTKIEAFGGLSGPHECFDITDFNNARFDSLEIEMKYEEENELADPLFPDLFLGLQGMQCHAGHQY